jgi:hypothetical protein
VFPEIRIIGAGLTAGGDDGKCAPRQCRNARHAVLLSILFVIRFYILYYTSSFMSEEKVATIDIVYAITTIISVYIIDAIFIPQYDNFRISIVSSLSFYLGAIPAQIAFFPLHVIVLVIAVKFINVLLFGFAITTVVKLKGSKKSITPEYIYLSATGIITAYLIAYFLRIASLFETAFLLEAIIILFGVPIVFIALLKLNRKLSFIGPV